MTKFLESSVVPVNGEFQRTVVYNCHIEAILRRCDYDWDGKLSYSEFYDLVADRDGKDLPRPIDKEKETSSEAEEKIQLYILLCI